MENYFQTEKYHVHVYYNLDQIKMKLAISGELKISIKSFPFLEAVSAHEAILARNTEGKVVLSF